MRNETGVDWIAAAMIAFWIATVFGVLFYMF